MRLLLRFVSFLALVMAVGIAVLDTVQSIARSRMDVTNLEAAWTVLSADSLAALRQTLLRMPGNGITGVASDWLLNQPLAALCLALSLLFWMAGYRRLPPAGRFAA